MSESKDTMAEIPKISLWATVVVHLLCWGISIVAFVAYVMRAMPMLQDLGIELTNAQMVVISITDWIVGGWFISLPLLVALVIGLNSLAFAILESRFLRWLWAILGCCFPFIVTFWMYLTIFSAFTMLHTQLS